MSMIKVKNKIGTATKNPPTGYGSWLEFWEKNRGEKALMCKAWLCSGKAEVGGHVIKSGESAKEYILPLCYACNNKPEGEEFNVSESYLIPVKQTLTSQEKDHSLGIQVVYNDLVKEGYSIEAVNTDLDKTPQIVASRQGRRLFFIVITGRGPLPTLSSETKRACELQAAKFEASCMFAPVALMPTGQRNQDGEEGFFVNYRGFSWS